MPEFEPLSSEDRQLIGEPEPPPPAPPARKHPWRVGLAAVLLLAGLAVVVSKWQDPPDTAATRPGPTAAPSRPAARAPLLPHIHSPVRLKLGAARLDLPGELASFDVAPDGYAAAVATDCARLSRCQVALGVSADGERWIRRPLPPQLGSDRVTVWSLGGGVLVIEEPRVLRMRSGDGGRTWTRVSLEPTEPVKDASAGTLTVTPREHPHRAPCGGFVLAVLRRDNGRTAPLRNQPPGVNPCSAMRHGDRPDNLWAAGVDPVTLQPVVAFSGDHGAGWAVSPLPDFRGDAARVWLSIAGPQVYATVSGLLGESPESHEVIAVFRRVGDGWQRTVSYTGPNGEIDGMIACPKGLLIAVQRAQGPQLPPRQLISHDHGMSWSAAVSQVLVTAADPSSPRGYGARYAWADTTLGRQGLVRSADCRTWHGVPVR